MKKKIIAWHIKDVGTGLLFNPLVKDMRGLNEFIKSINGTPSDFLLVGISHSFKEYSEIVKKYKN